MAEQEVLLEHDADRPALGGDEHPASGIVEHLAIELHLPAVEREQAGDGAQQRGLARPVRAEHRQHLAAGDRELDVEIERADTDAEPGLQRHTTTVIQPLGGHRRASDRGGWRAPRTTPRSGSG